MRKYSMLFLAIIFGLVSPVNGNAADGGERKECLHQRYAYIGCRTTRERNARGEGLKVFAIEKDSGDWQEIQLLKTEENPSYQTFDPTGKFMYSVHGDKTLVSAYSVAADGHLMYLNTVDIGAKNPVYIVVDKSNQYVIVATLQGGAVYSLKRNADGSLGDVADVARFEGKKQDAISFVHQSIWDRTGTYIFAPAQARVQGYGQIRAFRFDSSNGHFEQTCQVMSREYAEPRHAAVHPNNRFVYLLNEKGNTIVFSDFDAEKGALSPRQTISTLPETYCGESHSGGIVIDPSGQYVLSSNRIHDSIAVFRINAHTGYLTLVGHFDSLGKTPRFITFGPNGLFYVANEDSDTIVEMKLDDNGILKATGRTIVAESPVCITFSE